MVVGFVSAHVRPHRRMLAVSYGAAVVENTFELLYPFTIGLAVDRLLNGSWGGVTVSNLADVRRRLDGPDDAEAHEAPSGDT
jgi:hypothetical protein